MLRYIAKICFVVLLAFQNLDAADAHTYTYCSKPSYGCDKSSSCGRREDVEGHANSWADSTVGCKGGWYLSIGSCYNYDTNCGCFNSWSVTLECRYACSGFYVTKDESLVKRATRKLVKRVDGKEIEIRSFNGYEIDPSDPPCDNDNVFPARCKYENNWYRLSGEDVHCDHQVQQQGQDTIVFAESSCNGCAYCENGSIIYKDIELDGYQHGMEQEFIEDGDNSKCNLKQTPNWRCAPGYYKTEKIVEGVNPETDPNIDCAPCPAGTYNPNANAQKLKDCKTCDAGKTTFTGGVFDYSKGNDAYSTGNISAEACEPCPAGYYEEDKKCKPCSGNTYQDETGKTECKPCPTGFIIDNKDLQKNITQCYIDPPNITLKDSLGTINLADEIGSAPLYYVGP